MIDDNKTNHRFVILVLILQKALKKVVSIQPYSKLFYIFAQVMINVQAYEIPKYQKSVGCVAGVATAVREG